MTLPFSLLDERGGVLLAKGLTLTSTSQLDALKQRPQLFVPFEESDAIAKVLVFGLEELKRRNDTLNVLDDVALQEWMDRPTREISKLSMPDQCDDWIVRLRGLLGSIAQESLHADEAKYRLESFGRGLDAWLQPELVQETATLVLMYRACISTEEYAVLHSLQCAVLAWRLAHILGFTSEQTLSLTMAAATMNVGMFQLQDQLAEQTHPLTDDQRHLIDGHGVESECLLRAVDIKDELWLQIVRNHHLEPDSVPFAQLSVTWQLTLILQRLDRYTASLSPRASRNGLSSKEATRLVLGGNMSPTDNPVAHALLNLLGLYPPGTFVRLKSGDLALVLRPGVKASTPVVAIVVNRIGELLTLPKMVDCAQPEHAVENSIPGSLIKARINVDYMVRRLMYSRTQAFMSR